MHSCEEPRGEDILTSLKLVLSTISDDFQEQIFLYFPIIRRFPEEIKAFQKKPDHKLQIVLFPNQFVAVYIEAIIKSLTNAPLDYLKRHLFCIHKNVPLSTTA